MTSRQPLILRNSDFRREWVSQVLSQAGFWLGLMCGAGAGRFLPSTWRPTTIGGLLMLLFAALLAVPVFYVGAFAFMVCLFGCGLCLGVKNLKFVSLFQREVPAEARGRFFAVMQALLSSTFPVAYFVFGAASSFLGARGMLGVEAIGLALVSVALLIVGRTPRKL